MLPVGAAEAWVAPSINPAVRSNENVFLVSMERLLSFQLLKLYSRFVYQETGP
jgi:hypothetical protein